MQQWDGQLKGNSMATYEITSPTGETFEITAPDNASEQDVLSYAQSQFSQATPEPQQSFNPTDDMSFIQKLLAGTGKSFVDTAEGVKQLGAYAGEKVGLVSPETVARIQKEVDERALRDKPLMQTGAGIAGNIIGQAAQFSAPAGLLGKTATVANLAKTGAGGYGLAAGGGAAFGASQPVTSDQSRLKNIGLGAAGGVAGQALGQAIPKVANAIGARALNKATTKQLANAQKFESAVNANKLGYVIPPADLNPSITSEFASGLSGKIKTAQEASMRNQAVTDSLVKKSLGVADDIPLNKEVLSNIRAQAGNAYNQISNAGIVTPSKSYASQLDDSIKSFTSQAKSFPDRPLSPVVKDIQALKTNQFDAGDAVETIKLLRADADKAYRGADNVAGKAYKRAADILEDELDKHLVKTNAPQDLISSYRTARKDIAKTYTVEKALNPETGAVDAIKLANELRKGKPLSGELLEVAKTATAFPKAMQALKETPKATSPLDYAVAGTGAIATGNVLPLALVGARPAVRNALLSNMVQNRAIQGAAFKPSVMSQFMPKLANNPLLQQSAAPLGAIGLLNER